MNNTNKAPWNVNCHSNFKITPIVFAYALLFLLLTVPPSTAVAIQKEISADTPINIVNDHHHIKKIDIYKIGVQAYIYGLAPVIIQRTEKIFVNTPEKYAPVNKMSYSTRLATDNDTDVVTPNADTLYNTAWLELGKEPVVLHVPDTQDRYYVEQLIDAYTNNLDSVGRRTTGTKEGNFAIVGPNWHGKLPSGVKMIKSPTNTVWIIGRILVKGDSDLPETLSLQKQFTLTPLSQYGKSKVHTKNQTLEDFKKYMPSPKAQDKLQYFEELRVALKNNPSPKEEAALMNTFDKIGLGEKKTPYGKNLDPYISDELVRAIKDGNQIVTSTWNNMEGISINGWVYKTNLGVYGDDYLFRAAVALGGLGANVPEEAVYAKAQTGSDSQPLNGDHNYVVHFDKENIPPVDAFWSISIYNATNYLFVSNPINRYSIGDQTTGLRYNQDGSLDIYIQHDSPVGNESNWLPAPKGDYYLILRMYQPRAAILNGTYQIPQVQKTV